MRRSPLDSRRTLTLLLVVLNVLAFLAQLALERFTTFDVLYYGALSLDGLKQGHVWQLLTYQFMHAGPLHLLFNCLAIYFFGLEVEHALGRVRFLVLYLASGTIGGLVQILAGLALGNTFAAPVVGASAAAFGLVAAFAMLFPDRIILLFMILPLRARYLLIMEAIVAIWGMFGSRYLHSSGPQIADAAHIGGMLTGIFFARCAVDWNWEWPKLNRGTAKTPRRLVRVTSGSSGSWARKKQAAEPDLPPEDFLSREVDPILDKINAHGMQSLTERERRILEAARQKMAKR